MIGAQITVDIAIYRRTITTCTGNLVHRSRRQRGKEKSMSYIVKNGRIIAEIDARESGDVRWSRVSCAEEIDASRERNLVNAQFGKISNAVKYDRQWERMDGREYAAEINPGEFLIS